MKITYRCGRSVDRKLEMLRVMVTQLIEKERLMTGATKAKELSRAMDKVVTLCKRATRLPPYENYDDAQAMLAFKALFGEAGAADRGGTWVQTEWAQFKLMTELMERYQDRVGGYTRVLKCSNRETDDAELAMIELVDREGEMRPARVSEARLEAMVREAQAAVRKANDANVAAVGASAGSSGSGSTTTTAMPAAAGKSV